MLMDMTFMAYRHWSASHDGQVPASSDLLHQILWILSNPQRTESTMCCPDLAQNAAWRKA